MTAIHLRTNCAWATALIVGSMTLAQAQNTTTRVSVATGGAQAPGVVHCQPLAGGQRQRSIRCVSVVRARTLFRATRTTPKMSSYDRQTGLTELVSVGPAGVLGNGNSVFPRVSADGRFVSFYSIATNLVAGDTNGTTDVFVRDRQAGATTRVSVGTGTSKGTEGAG